MVASGPASAGPTHLCSEGDPFGIPFFRQWVPPAGRGQDTSNPI